MPQENSNEKSLPLLTFATELITQRAHTFS